MELWVAGIFLAGLVVCIVTNLDILFALGLGMVVFAAFALCRGLPLRRTLLLMWKGVSRLGNLALILLLIGAVNGVWRACGTIPYLVYFAVDWIDPRFFALWSFLLCSLMSLLVGSSVCAASVMGVVLMLVARSAGASILPVGGAILAGCFFGDRCSPMSSSANLVAAATNTNLYGNVKNMLRSGAVPLALSVLIYLLFPASAGEESGALRSQIVAGFNLHGALLLPAVVIVALSIFRTDVKISLAAGLGAALIVGITVQKESLLALLQGAVSGFLPGEGQAGVLAGGGILSMAHVFGIIGMSATYPELFRATGLTETFGRPLQTLAGKLSPQTATALYGVPVAMVSCSQSLGVMLLAQICLPCFDRKEDAALAIEDSVILLAPLIPWSTAFAASAAILGVGPSVIPSAVYLYLLPLLNALWYLRRHLLGRRIRP